MGTRVADAVHSGEPVRQIAALTQTVESELQHLHSREMESLPQCVNLRCDDAKVLRDDRQTVSKSILDRLEQFISGRGDPLAVDGGLLAVRNRPVSGADA